MVGRGELEASWYVRQSRYKGDTASALTGRISRWHRPVLRGETHNNCEESSITSRARPSRICGRHVCLRLLSSSVAQAYIRGVSVHRPNKDHV